MIIGSVQMEKGETMRPIDADELKDHQFHGCYTNIHIASNTDAYMLGWNDAIDAIVECAPTIDAEPVKHAKLVNPNPFGECSLCGYLIDIRQEYTYCPNCGSKMDVLDTNVGKMEVEE